MTLALKQFMVIINPAWATLYDVTRNPTWPSPVMSRMTQYSTYDAIASTIQVCNLSSEREKEHNIKENLQWYVLKFCNNVSM